MDEPNDWEIYERAADATFATLPTYTNRPFSRAEWDELYAGYEAVTDMAAFFGKELIEAYPETKVVLVQRDFDKWFKSIDDGIFWWFDSTILQFYMDYIEPLLGLVAVRAGRKEILGYFEAKDIKEARRNARQVYDRHYRTIPTLLPPERLLHFRLEDGWGPLCEFLDKPVPDVPFPRVNEAAALQAAFKAKLKRDFLNGAAVVLKWSLSVGVVGVGIWMMSNKFTV
jgi:hypothetical protein